MTQLALAGHGDLRIVDARTGRLDWSLSLTAHEAFTPDERGWIAWYRGTTDEIKPLPGGRLLVTSVAGPVVVIERAGGALTRLAWLPGAHSAEMLPDGRFVAAVSTHPDTPPGAPRRQADCLCLIEPGAPARIVWEGPFPHCHGCVWDAAGRSLWVLGGAVLARYALDAAGVPVEQERFELPDEGGHDLVPCPAKGGLMLTTNQGVFTFTPDAGFTPVAALGGLAKVKSVSVHPGSGQVAYVVADDGLHMTNRIRFAQPDGQALAIEPNVYKARWLVEA